MTFPKKIFVTHDANSSEAEDLLAWTDLNATDDGKVGVYVLERELDKRSATEIRAKGSKQWQKPWMTRLTELIPLGDILDLLNRVNEGNPNYRPYEVAEES